MNMSEHNIPKLRDAVLRGEHISVNTQIKQERSQINDIIAQEV
jgi:hypothetical protein